MTEANKDVFRGVILWAILTLGGYLLFRYGYLWITCVMWTAFFMSIMDTLNNHFEDSYFNKLNPNFWNKTISGVNKWKNRDPKQGERFLFSSTLLVFVTEGWHLAKFLMLKCMVLSIVLYTPIFTWYYDALITATTYGTIFTIFYFLYERGKTRK